MNLKRVSYFMSLVMALAVMIVTMNSCDDDDPKMNPKDPDTAPKASVDRFSSDAGTLMVRGPGNSLPAANAAINFDSGEPFITKGLGPSGQMVEYYNFDVQSLEPAPIYVLQRDNETSPVSGQLNIIDDIPGDDDYNDFWHVHMVTVPSNYVANTVASFEDIQNAGYTITETTTLVNCPVVPEGSTASKRVGGGTSSLIRGWYRDQVVFYFTFGEKALTTTGGGMVPTSPIYVTFNIDAGQPDGGPASGFKTETGTMQTHNVVQTIPSSASYSPLWAVSIYDNDDFDDVTDLTSAQGATIIGPGPTVNCPIVTVP